MQSGPVSPAPDGAIPAGLCCQCRPVYRSCRSQAFEGEESGGFVSARSVGVVPTISDIEDLAVKASESQIGDVWRATLIAKSPNFPCAPQS